MLLPISHEKMTTRRLPVVTVALIVVTILLHAVASVGTSAREERAMGAMMTARLRYLQRPSLGICTPLRPFVSRPVDADSPRDEAVERLADESEKRDVADRYEAACKELADSLDGIAAQRFGYVPARANLLGLVTYAFVHADWWHVIGNMWFLFLCGLALEDRWGRLPFAVFYVLASVVAAGIHHLALPDSSAALIGASGAVAGAMGAFVVLFAKTKIRFVGFLGFRLFSFAAPAFVMLPLWAAVEIGYGMLTKSSGTAHWAHVGGFAFGLVVAGVFRMVGVDRHLDDAVERAAVLGNDPRVDAARALVAKGEAEQAIALLEGLAKEKPESIHVWEALRDVARAHGDESVAVHATKQMAALDAARGRPSGSVPRASTAPPASPGRASVPSVRAAAPSGRGSVPSIRPSVPGTMAAARASASESPSPSVSVSASVSANANARESAAVAVVEPAPFFPPPPPK